MPQGLVLIVDDDLSIRDSLALFLAGEGFRVRTAANGASALAVVEQETPALVLLDMRMPVLDGWGFARELAARGQRLPLVVMTAAFGSLAETWAAEVGAVTAIAKPFNLLDVLEIVSRYADASTLPSADTPALEASSW